MHEKLDAASVSFSGRVTIVRSMRVKVRSRENVKGVGG